MCIQMGSPAAPGASPQPSCSNPGRTLTYSGLVLSQSFDLIDVVLLGRLLALPHLTLPQYAVLFTFIPHKEGPAMHNVRVGYLSSTLFACNLCS